MNYTPSHLEDRYKHIEFKSFLTKEERDIDT